MRFLPLWLVILAAPAVPATAQTPATEFTAAAVRPNSAGGQGSNFQIFPGGQFRATNATVRQLVQAAFDFQLERFQIVGGPAWIDVDRFDVQGTPAAEATAGRMATPQEIAVRIQALLADRFRLVLRRETREMDRFDLVVGRDGAKLVPNTGTCVQPAPQQAAGETRPACRFSFPPDSGDVQHLVGVGVSVGGLARRLQQQVEAVVVDKTGLAGSYDLTLDYLRARNLDGQTAGTGVSIFTAVQEQLGLRLERTRGPVDVVVIESVERPTAN